MNAVKNNIIRPTSMQARFNDLYAVHTGEENASTNSREKWSSRLFRCDTQAFTQMVTHRWSQINVRQTRLATFSSQRNSVLSLVISRRDFCRLSC